MNSRRDHPANLDDDALERVFEFAARRPTPPADDESAIRASAMATWRDVVRQRQTRRRRHLAVAACALLAMIAAGLWLAPGQHVAPVMTVATVEVTRGDAHVRAGGDLRLLAAGDTVASGRRLETGRDISVALRWRGGASLRLREHTVLDIGDDGQATLIAGGVYIDTHAIGGTTRGGEPLLLRTRFGNVVHVGTQYMTEVEDNQLRVRVREGLVSIVDEQAQVLVEAGERLDRDATGRVTRHAQEGFGADWQWAEELAPRVNFNGRPIAEFLVWVGRETGRTVHYASPEARALATTETIRGNVDPEPGIALAILHALSDLRASVSDGQIVVRIAADVP